MEGYVRFSNSSPPASYVSASSRPFQGHDSPSNSSTDSAVFLDSPQQQHSNTCSGLRQRSGCSRCAWLAPSLQCMLQRWRQPTQRPYESNYMTLVPLSDARLKPRRTKLIVTTLLLLALLAVTGVFLLVPRGVSVGTIEVHSTKMTFNQTTHTYRIILNAEVPFYNPNYLKASVTGNLTVSFYDAEAGWSAVGPFWLAARSDPKVLSVNVDASNLPRKYTQVVYGSCFAFPRKLIFFLLGTFQTTYLGYVTTLPSIDTYFVLDCSGAESQHHDSSSGGSSGSSAAQQLSLAPQHQQQQQTMQQLTPIEHPLRSMAGSSSRDSRGRSRSNTGRQSHTSNTQQLQTR